MKTEKGTEGTHTITVEVEVDGTVVTVVSIDVVLR